MKIGIDLGTTFSVAAYMDENNIPHIIPNSDGNNTTPSAVFFDNNEIIVGIEAKKNAVVYDASVVEFIKRKMGESDKIEILNGDSKIYKTPEEISAIILKKIVKDAEEFLGKKVDGAVITVPAFFTDAQNKATQNAAKIAGIKVLRIIKEPTAAVLAYGAKGFEGEQIVLVFDFGGGTFDVTIAKIYGEKIDVLSTHGDRKRGGKDIDDKLLHHCAEEILSKLGIDIFENTHEMQILRTLCEEAKISLSRKSTTSIPVSFRGKSLRIELSRNDFEKMIKPIIEITGLSIDIAIEEANIEPRQIDKVLLVGGSSLIPAVSEFIERKLEIKPNRDANPHEIVAIGAAICASNILEEICDTEKCQDDDVPNYTEDKLLYTDCNAHGFGIVVAGEKGERKNSVIIPRNQPLLKKFTKVFYTSQDAQREVTLEVTEGEDANLDYITILGECTIRLNIHAKGSPVAIEFCYDSNGIIYGRAFDLFGIEFERDSNKYLIGDISLHPKAINLGEIKIKRKLGLSEIEVEEMKKSTLVENII